MLHHSQQFHMDKKQKCGLLLTSVLLLLLGTTGAHNVTTDGVEHSMDSENVTGEPIIEILASAALPVKSETNPESGHQSQGTGQPTAMQAAYAGPYSPWRNDDDSHFLPARPFSGSSPYERDQLPSLGRYQPQMAYTSNHLPMMHTDDRGQITAVSKNRLDSQQPPLQQVDDNWPMSYSDDGRQMPYADDAYPNSEQQYSAAEIGSDALEYMASQMEAMKPALKNAFLSNILDFLFQNNSNSPRNANAYLPQVMGQQSFSPSVGDTQNYKMDSNVPAQSFPQNRRDDYPPNGIFKRNANPSDFTSLRTNREASRSPPSTTIKPSPLHEQKQPDDLEPQWRNKVREDFLKELAMPIIIKPIIVALPESQITTEGSNGAGKGANENPMVQRSVNPSEAIARLEDNVIHIPSTRGDSPNTWYVYGKQNYLILQSDQTNATTQSSSSSERPPLPTATVKPGGSSDGKQVEDEPKLTKTKRCDCEIKCHACSNDPEDQSEAARLMSDDHRRSVAARDASAHKRSLPNAAKTFPRIAIPGVDHQPSNFRQHRGRIHDAQTNQLLSFDDSRSAEPAPEYSDLDYVASEAAKYQYQDGKLVVNKDHAQLDHPKYAIEKKYYDEDTVKSYIESLRSMKLHGEKSTAFHSGARAADDIHVSKTEGKQHQHQKLQEPTPLNAIVDDNETSKELLESHSEKHNIVKKNLSPNDMPPDMLQKLH